ncbi:MAG: 4Fe-4S dicluster domain-containing protein [Candidatus Acetothermia bacterium]|nr:4Fe-4S dicluster domain-containing protein [Candidatus Acetothermia bacterium]MDH7506005.1 4Fe-4S dicluster domain-containing protein [Candidatus Acetothermia bacterium]
MRGIKFEAELDRAFARWATTVPGGERIRECIQCGACSAACPMSGYMDYTPRRIIALVKEGFKDEVLSSRTIWLCASCYACAVECPQGINITDFMYALKERAIKEGRYPKGLPTPIYAQEFARLVRARGRSTESLLVIRAALRLNPLRLLKLAPLGLRLLLRGRMGLRPEQVRDRAAVRAMLTASENAKSREE